MLNKYFAASFTILALFVLLAAFVSPKINHNVNSSIAKSDSMVFLDINNSHYYTALNKGYKGI